MAECPVVCIIGCGRVGMRHVEALGKLRRRVTAYAIDPNAEAVVRASALFEAAKRQAQGSSVLVAGSSVDDLPASVDVAIVATPAQSRLDVTEQLLSRVQVTTAIFEKFLFPKESDYQRAATLVSAIVAGAWVNCPRRIYPSYRDLAHQLVGSSFVELTVSARASFAPIGGIAIHYADLLGFLSAEPEMNLEVTIEDAALIPTRRDLCDFAGTLTAVSASGRSRLRYSARQSTDAPLTVYIEADNARVLIDEARQKAYLASVDNSWQFSEIPFLIPLQSELTDLLVEELITTRSCGLPTYEESARIHLGLLRPLVGAHRAVMHDPSLEHVPFT